jgi:molybdate transport system substrate-binding protein
VKRILTAVAAAGLLAGCTVAPADDALGGSVTVLAAASLTDVFDDLAARFEADNPGVDVVLSFGGSSALAEQIVAGAPADVFAAADAAPMTRVADETTDPAVFASNTLQLAVPVGNPAGVRGLADLADPGLAVALCDPAVPCGAAAVELLDLAGVTASVDTLESDVRAALTKVALGEVDAALVYRTDVLAAGATVEGVAVPEAADVVNRYPIAVLRDARNPGVAQAFLDFVLSATGREVLRDAGFGAP